jgi:hypothetical protein
LAATDGTTLNWTMMKHALTYIDNLNHILEYHKAGHLDVRYVSLLHSLNWKNCVKKDGGRASVNGWREFISKEPWPENTRQAALLS